MSKLAKVTQKLFVGNLPFTISSKELKQYFSKFGHVSTSSVIFDRQSGISRGYGFIVFSTKDGYLSATNKLHHLEGRTLTIQNAAS